MKSNELPSKIEQLIKTELIDKFRDESEKSAEYKENIPGFLINPELIHIYWFKHHIAIMINGDELNKNRTIRKINFQHDFLLDQDSLIFSAITNTKLESEEINKSSNALLKIAPFTSDSTFLFAGITASKLLELGWRIEGFSPRSCIIFNFMENPTPINQAAFFQNTFVFVDNGNNVTTRHIKWLSIIPYELILNKNKQISSIKIEKNKLAALIKIPTSTKYYIPQDYKKEKFYAINNFIQLWSDKRTKEVDITRFLSKSENQFILSMHFGATNIYPELLCPLEINFNQSIRPDFFIENPDGYCDIVEFKLPFLHKKIIVGQPNRRRFSSWFSEYIAQTRVYKSYFDDKANRQLTKEIHNINLLNPRRVIVIGRRKNFNIEETRTLLSDHNNLRVMSYDDLIDGVVAQLYK